ncbi:MAG TPA: hypothetical protein PKA03_02730 [Tabrizicola sp.]|nr:hypothetical protein [Tabrizicola sp.]
MRHDWILDVLTDLHAYACRNDFPGLAEKVEVALIEALREIEEKNSGMVAGASPFSGRKRPN